MNRREAKDLVSSLHYLSAVTEGVFLSLIDDDQSKGERLMEAAKTLEHSCEVISRMIGRLYTVDPEFHVLNQEVTREAMERGKKFSEERAEKIALLRLAGDDTPEENIPL